MRANRPRRPIGDNVLAAGSRAGRHLLLKVLSSAADAVAVSESNRLPARAGPVPDRLTIWPVDDGRYGLDATFQGASGYARVERHEVELKKDGVPHKIQQELDGGWTIRFGPLRVVDLAQALGAFVY